MTAASSALTAARAAIDRLDRRLVALLARRQASVESIALLKGDPDQVYDAQRARAVLRRVRRRAIRAGLDPSIALPVWRTLMDKCAAHEAGLLQAVAARRMTNIKAGTWGGR